jgi:flagellar motor component MotA
MDIATIVGLIGTFGLIFSAIDDINAFIDVPSILIVFAGSIMVVLFVA